MVGLSNTSSTSLPVSSTPTPTAAPSTSTASSASVTEAAAVSKTSSSSSSSSSSNDGPVRLTKFGRSDLYRRYSGIYITLKCFLPFALLLVANSAILWNLWWADVEAARHNRRKITNSLVFILIFRLACLMPDCFLSLFYDGAYIDAPNNIKVSFFSWVTGHHFTFYELN